MKVPLLRPRSGDESEGGTVAEPDAETVGSPPIATASEQLSATMATRAWSVLLAACLVLGPIGTAVGVYTLLTRPPDAVSTPTSQADTADDRVSVGEFALRVVVAWLTATQDHPGELLALVHLAEPPMLSRAAFTVAAPTVSQIRRVSGGSWSVTVSATVTDANRATARRYYQVPIDFADGSLTALTLPAPVAGPSVSTTSRSAYDAELTGTGAAGATVAQFLAAYLTGKGDVARYVTPGVALTALRPAPYREIRLDELRATDDIDETAPPADGHRVRVLATSTATVNAQQACTLTYALTLAGRGGRWEINAIDPTPAAPSHAVDQPSADTQPSSVTPNPATSTTR